MISVITIAMALFLTSCSNINSDTYFTEESLYESESFDQDKLLKVESGYMSETNMETNRQIMTSSSAIPADTSGCRESVTVNTIVGSKEFKGFSQHEYDGKNAWLANSGCGVGAFLSAVGPFISRYGEMDMQDFYEEVLESGELGEISRSGSIGYGGMRKLIEEYADYMHVEIVQDYTFPKAALDIEEHLYTGQPVVITVMPENRGDNGSKDRKYTETGRFLALLGMTDEGYVIAADCGSDKPWSIGGEKQLRIKYGNLRDIVNHTRPVADYKKPDNWYTWRGSNGYMKIFVDIEK